MDSMDLRISDDVWISSTSQSSLPDQKESIFRGLPLVFVARPFLYRMQIILTQIIALLKSSSSRHSIMHALLILQQLYVF